MADIDFDISDLMVSGRVRDAWTRLAGLLAEWTPHRPMDVDLPKHLLTLLFEVLDDPEAAADELLDLARDPDHAELFLSTVERRVCDVITTVQVAPPLIHTLGDSPTTARGEGVTGPVTPADAESVYERETGGFVCPVCKQLTNRLYGRADMSLRCESCTAGGDGCA